MTVAERLDRLSMPEPNSGCWLWLGNVNKQGYGRITMRPNGSKLAHRVSWQTFRGPIPTSDDVLHRCDVRCCINPDHLFVGTHSDNMLDMYAKKRHSIPNNKGTAHPNRKLTDEDVRQIRAIPKGTPGLPARFGVNNSVICVIRKGTAWKHIPIKREI